VDVPAILDSAIPSLLAELVQAGTLVSLSTTKDGGALGLTITMDGEWVREYFREAESAVEWLAVVLSAVQEEVGARPASAARSTVPRRRRGG
jgi:hypothetical protein